MEHAWKKTKVGILIHLAILTIVFVFAEIEAGQDKKGKINPENSYAWHVLKQVDTNGLLHDCRSGLVKPSFPQNASYQYGRGLMITFI